MTDFAERMNVAEFVRHSTPQERKQALKRFNTCLWTEPVKGRVVYQIPLHRASGQSKSSGPKLVLGAQQVAPYTLLSPAQVGSRHNIRVGIRFPDNHQSVL